MEKLGIDSKLLIAQIINFSLIVVVLTKFLYKPIIAILEKRKREIEEGLALTEKLKIEEEKLKEKREKILEAARKEAQEIMTQGKKDGKEQEREIIANAHLEGSDIIAKATEEAVRIKESLTKQLRAEAVTIATEMTKQLLKKALSKSDMQKILETNIKDLETLKKEHEYTHK